MSAYLQSKWVESWNVLVAHAAKEYSFSSVGVWEDGVADEAAYLESRKGSDVLVGQVVKYLLNKHFETNGKECVVDSISSNRLSEAVHASMHEISSSYGASIHEESLCSDGNSLVEVLSLDEFSKATALYTDKMIKRIKASIRHSGIPLNEIDDVILTGDFPRIPTLLPAITALFPNKVLLRKIQSDRVFAYGAARFASELEPIPFDMSCKKSYAAFSPTSIGVQLWNGSISWFIHVDSLLPVQRSQIFSTTFANPQVLKIYEGPREQTIDFTRGDQTYLSVFSKTGIHLIDEFSFNYPFGEVTKPCRLSETPDLQKSEERVARDVAYLEKYARRIIGKDTETSKHTLESIESTLVWLKESNCIDLVETDVHTKRSELESTYSFYVETTLRAPEDEDRLARDTARLGIYLDKCVKLLDAELGFTPEDEEHLSKRISETRRNIDSPSLTESQIQLLAGEIEHEFEIVRNGIEWEQWSKSNNIVHDEL
ncbi:UNVERIFIED_CONTAM: hypothetical protein HDU68_001485 [Siphonaria sp. JEL0065]|nr:hypothetical protein HDU68_001485 [Siphonaria sp. JEL0065]